MKKVFMLLAIVAVFAACQKETVMEDDLILKGAVVGDQELVGEHFNLNIIGVKEKTMDDIAGGNVIFVNLYGESIINLKQAPAGESFAVLDKNGTDADGALFQLPEPGFEPYVTELPEGFDTETDYSVFIRPLGKPDMTAQITTVASMTEAGVEMVTKQDERLWKNIITQLSGCTVTLTWGEWLPQPIDVQRAKGKSLWINVTADLLSVVYELLVETDCDGDGVVDQTYTLHVRIPIFSEMLEGEYWKYVNNGLKLLQVRFYPFGTDVTTGDEWDSPF